MSATWFGSDQARAFRVAQVPQVDIKRPILVAGGLAMRSNGPVAHNRSGLPAEPGVGRCDVYGGSASPTRN
jgi:hypothetical protein